MPVTGAVLVPEALAVPSDTSRVRPARRRQARGGPLLQQPVDDLVHRAVPAHGDDHVHAVGGRLGGDLARVAAAGGLDHVDLELPAQGADQDVAHPGSGAGGHRIDHHERSHDGKVNQGRRICRSGVPRSPPGPHSGGRGLTPFQVKTILHATADNAVPPSSPA
jgi:hypothetical protein